MDRNILQKITELRHYLHAHPELSGQERETIGTLQEFLRRNTSLEIVDGDGWFYAMKKGTSGDPPIAFRADMDALPMAEGIDLPYASVNDGISHKCGHDGHSAALCGLAMELDRREVKRNIFLIFQPAEETGAGAAKCCGLIREKGIAEIYAFHNISGYPVGSVLCRYGMINAASEGLLIRLAGRQSHASAPEAGINPAYAAAKLVLFAREELPGLLFPSEAETGKTDPSSGSSRFAFCTLVGMKCGEGDFGISAGDGSVSFTLRADDEAVMKEMEARLIDCASKLAEEERLRMSFEIKDYFPETRNHDPAVDKVFRTAALMGLKPARMEEPWLASEDFGRFLRKCPGAMFYIGNGEDHPPVHTAPFDFNDRILETAVDMFIGLACGAE